MLFAEIFSKKSNLYDSGVSLAALLPRTNLKLHIIAETSGLIKVITDLDSSKGT